MVVSETGPGEVREGSGKGPGGVQESPGEVREGSGATLHSLPMGVRSSLSSSRLASPRLGS